MLCDALERCRSAEFPNRRRRRRAVPCAAGLAGHRPSHQRTNTRGARDGRFRGRPAGARAISAGSPTTTRPCSCGSRGSVAAPRSWRTWTDRCTCRHGHAHTAEPLAPHVAERVIFDFGLVRSLGYYTGAVFQVYDPAHGVPLGSGGRYDELLGELRAAAARGRLRAGRGARPHRADGGGARRWLKVRPPSGCGSPCRAGALFNDTLDLLERSASTRRRSGRTTASSCSRMPGSSRCAPRTCRLRRGRRR